MFKTKEEAIQNAREQCSDSAFVFAKVYVKQNNGSWQWGLVMGRDVAMPEGAERISKGGVKTINS
jgi:hypothetical protein